MRSELPNEGRWRHVGLREKDDAWCLEAGMGHWAVMRQHPWTCFLCCLGSYTRMSWKKEINIMWVLLMISANSLGFIFLITNMKSFRNFKVFQTLVEWLLDRKIYCHANWLGRWIPKAQFLFLPKLASFIMCLALMLTSKMALLKGDIATLWKWVSHFLLMHQCRLSSAMKLS